MTQCILISSFFLNLLRLKAETRIHVHLNYSHFYYSFKESDYRKILLVIEEVEKGEIIALAVCGAEV